jgi:hypothetical protein
MAQTHLTALNLLTAALLGGLWFFGVWWSYRHLLEQQRKIRLLVLFGGLLGALGLGWVILVSLGQLGVSLVLEDELRRSIQDAPGYSTEAVLEVPIEVLPGPSFGFQGVRYSLAELPRLQQDLAKVPRSALVVIEADERVAYEDVKKLIETLELAGMDRVAFTVKNPTSPKE